MGVTAERDMFVIDSVTIVRWASTGAPLGVGDRVGDAITTPEAIADAVDRVGAGESHVEFSTRLLPNAVLIRGRVEPISGATGSLVHLELWHPGGVLPSDFSERYLQVVRGIASGVSQRAIAEHLGISRGTIESYVRRIQTRIGAPTTAHVIQWAVRHGLANAGAQESDAAAQPKGPRLSAAVGHFDGTQEFESAAQPKRQREADSVPTPGQRGDRAADLEPYAWM